MQNFTGCRMVRLTKCRQRAILKQQMQGTGKVARAVRPRECGTAESRARAPRERTPGSSKLNTAARLPLSRCAAGPALQGQRLNKRARERPDTSGNSGGTADITRQLVRPELSGQKLSFFFVKENYSGTYRDPFAVQEHPGGRHRDHCLRLGKEHPRLQEHRLHRSVGRRLLQDFAGRAGSR